MQYATDMPHYSAKHIVGNRQWCLDLTCKEWCNLADDVNNSRHSAHTVVVVGISRHCHVALTHRFKPETWQQRCHCNILHSNSAHFIAMYTCQTYYHNTCLSKTLLSYIPVRDMFLSYISMQNVTLLYSRRRHATTMYTHR